MGMLPPPRPMRGTRDALEEAIRNALGDNIEHFEFQVHEDILTERVLVLILNKKNDLSLEVGIDVEQLREMVSSELPATVQCQVSRVRGISKEAAESVLLLGGIEPLLKMLEVYEDDEKL